MSSIKDLSCLKPIRSRYKSDFEFKVKSAHWEKHIAPVIIRLENIAQTRPVKSNFENDEEFEEALGFWIGRQSKVISVNLSQALSKWKELSQTIA